MRKYSVLATAMAAATLALAAGSASATSVPQAPDALVLTVVTPSMHSPEGLERAVTLSCTPVAGGDHPHSIAACSVLIGVQGRFASLPVATSLCPHIYIPVTVTAVGVWNGERTNYLRTFTNQCVMLRATGEVFNF